MVVAPAVYAVSIESQKALEDRKVYTAADACMFGENIDPYNIAERIIYGEAITKKYKKLLSGISKDYLPPHYLAYALYHVAREIGDIRAQSRINWLSQYVSKDAHYHIIRVLNRKYKQTYLEKCFTVPNSYKHYEKSLKERIFEEDLLS